MSEREYSFNPSSFEARTSPVTSELTPSAQLIDRLFARQMTPVEEIAKLHGMKVKLMAIPNNEAESKEIIGDVLAVEGRDILVAPTAMVEIDEGCYQHNIPVKNAEPITATAYFLSDNPYDCDWVDQNDPDVELAIFRDTPNRMHLFRNGVDEVRFSKDDPELDKVLEQVLKQFPEIKTTKDIASLTAFTHDLIPYRAYQEPKEKGIFSYPKLGTELVEYGSVCRHIAAVTMAALELRGVEASFVVNKSGKGGTHGSHGYLAIDKGLEDQTERIIADPTWNTSGTQTEVLTKLLARGESLQHHLPENATLHQFEPDWHRSE
jgi:hypothetical protein